MSNNCGDLEETHHPCPTHDPSHVMLHTTVGPCRTTMSLDDTLAIVHVLQERCQPDILHTIYQPLLRVLASVAALS